jgi:sugar phosphate isomerase/epimerase
MSRRPITLFTGQWADLPFTEVCQLASQWGYDGLEIACWGDHLDVARGASDDAYLAEHKHILADYGLAVYAISNHLIGQAVCDHPIDERHQGILSTRVWGDGEPEGVRQRAAEDMKDTARTAARLGVDTVVGFTGSSIWHTVAMFLPSHVARSSAGMPTSPTGGTRSWTSSTRWASGSRTRCTRRKSLTTTGRRSAPWRRSAAGRRSA